MKKLLLTFFLSVFLLSPVAIISAQAPSPSNVPLDYSGFVKCDGVVKESEPGRQRQCNFIALMDTIIKAINWLFYIAIPIATVILAYGGYLYMTGIPGKMEQARSMFAAVVVGFIIMLTAWIIMRTAINWVVNDPTATTFIR